MVDGGDADVGVAGGGEEFYRHVSAQSNVQHLCVGRIVVEGRLKALAP
jgi:hypothetical protein